MANSVTFPTALGGDGSTVTDDADPTTGLANGGHRLRFVPALSQAVIMSQTAASKAAAAAADRQQTGEDRAAVAADKTAAQDARSGAEALYGDLDAVDQAKTAAQDYAGQASDSAAEAAADAATADQHRIDAEAARDAANVAGQVYADTAAGLAATGDGQYFKTPAASAEGFLTLYRNDAGVADPIDTFPSLNGVAAAVAKINDQQTRLTRSLAAVGDHGQSLHSDFAIGAYALGNRAGLNRSVSDAEMWTCNRASPGATYDENGVLGEAGIDELRYGYDFETGRRYLLAEPRRTNEVPYSSDLTQNAPFYGGSDITLESDPRFGQISSVAQGSGVSSGISMDGTSDWYVTLIVKPVGCNHIIVNLRYNGDNRYNWIEIDISAGNVVNTGGSSDPLLEEVRDLGDGWKALIIKNDLDGSQSSLNIRASSGVAEYSDYGIIADAGSRLLVAHMQAEQGAYPTSIIHTDGAPVTREADDPRRTMGSEYREDSGTIFFEGVRDFVDDGREYPLLAIPTTNTHYTRLVVDTAGSRTGALDFSTRGPDENQHSVQGETGAISSGVRFKCAATFSVDGIMVAVDGVVSELNAVPSDKPWPSVIGQPLVIGENTQAVNITTYPRAMSAAELEALTA